MRHREKCRIAGCITNYLFDCCWGGGVAARSEILVGTTGKSGETVDGYKTGVRQWSKIDDRLR